MQPDPLAVTRDADAHPLAVLRVDQSWGLPAYDLLHPPARFWGEAARPIVESNIDARSVRPAAPPSSLLAGLPEGENWQAVSRRTIARLFAYFLLCEDPQRRLDARVVNTLAHQVSLVRHVLDSPHLRRVLVADEVGLGKTVEAGLIVQELLARDPTLRVLYLAPARLVPNVRGEFDRLGLGFRQWSAGESDGRLIDSRLVASVHRAVHPRHMPDVTASGPWHILVIDECHHLTDWAEGGGDPTLRYRLVRDLIARQPPGGRLLMLSGTPHQGHPSRFRNLLGLLRESGEAEGAVSGRVIYRTKDDVVDWEGRPLFPRRQVNPPLVVDVPPAFREWLSSIHAYFRPTPGTESRVRAAGWRAAQAMQWATSSPQAGLGYLARQAVRQGWAATEPALREALAALRPYRRGAADEPIDTLFARLRAEVARQAEQADIEDIEDAADDVDGDRAGLADLLRQGVCVLTAAGDSKWDEVWRCLLEPAGGEKAVLFAQPIETVTAAARYLERVCGRRPALITGGQTDEERGREVASFRGPDGPQFLVSSRAGGEGINLQVARRLIHLDVPWNPMDLEQRVGRVHRFGSRETILVDTVVVRESRETEAYRVARQRLEQITATMVEPERFESVFARVMCLVSPQELGEVIGRGTRLPLAREEQDHIAALVRSGFQAWQDFDRDYAGQQRQMRAQEAGLARWPDVAELLVRHAGATPADGFRAARFARVGERVEHTPGAADAVRTADGRALACGDYAGSPVYGPGDEPAAQAGLNVEPVPATLRRLAFPAGVCGPCHLRWPDDAEPPEGFGPLPWGVLVFARQSVRSDTHAGWQPQPPQLRCYRVAAVGEPVEVTGAAKDRLLRGLFAASVRARPEAPGDLVRALRSAEEELAFVLRRPSDEDRNLRTLHAVSPLLVGVVAGPR